MDEKRQDAASRDLLALERERLQLEGEKLALERERLAGREAELDALRESLGPAEGRGASFGGRVLAAAALAAALLGGFVGSGAGWDAGRAASPAPRRVVVGRPFLSMMNRVSAVHRWARDEESAEPGWLPARRTEFPENLVIVR